MGISKEDSLQLVEQLQHAHKVSVAFYQRILPTFDDIANQLACVFWNWKPSHTSMPSRASKPSNAWAWDYIPLYASEHTYGYTLDSNSTNLDDFALTFQLYIDDNFEPKNRRHKGQPDAVVMPNGRAIVRVYLLRALEESTKTLKDYWMDADFPSVYDGTYVRVGENMEGTAFEWNLSDLIMDTNNLIDQLKKLSNRAT